MGDVVGRLFREFAITLGITILISAVVSLTLTPMMCSRLLKHTPEAQQGRFFQASGHMLDRIIELYGTTLRWVLERQKAAMVVFLGTLALTVLLCLIVPKGFFRRRYRGDPGYHGSLPIDLLSLDDRAPAGAFGSDTARSRRREPLFLYRHRRDQRDPQQRPHPYQSQALIDAKGRP